MILLADSGSTKTHWCLLTASGQSTDVRTDGINPVLQSYDAVYATISDQLLPAIARLLWAGTISHVFFYGAGCTPEKKIIVRDALQSVFKKAQVTVESDMLGAARALLGHHAGVACILGTGSGSCFYNGEKIAWSVPSLGYILGDEGSGAVLGKRLVGDIMKNQLGDELKEAFLAAYKLTTADIIDRVYKQPFPNRFLAKLSKFCADHISDPRIHALVYDHFVQFIRRNLVQYKTDQPISFVGSIAYYYKGILAEAMHAEGLPLGSILQDPIEGLKNYHKDVIVPTT